MFRGSYPEDLLEVFGRASGRPSVLAATWRSRRSRSTSSASTTTSRTGSPPTRRGRSACASRAGRPAHDDGLGAGPSGLHEILTRVRRDYGDIPIYITENGAAFDDGNVVDGFVDDPARAEYLEGHLAALARAIADGVDVRRYFAWSFLDNFEWEHGYEQRFGIVHVDYATQRRVPKRSGLWYRDHIAAPREGELMAGIVFEGVGKVFADGTTAVAGLDLAIPRRRVLLLVGPSGSGKSTALRMVAGLEEVTPARSGSARAT